MTLNELNKISSKENIFRFSLVELDFIILGYPYCRAFISLREQDFWIEIQPEINLWTKRITLSEKVFSKKNKKTDSNIVTLDQTIEQKFFSTFPKDITEQVIRFPDSHWDIIKAILQYVDMFSSFIKSNPTLAYILVNLDKFNASYSLYNDLNFLELTVTNKQKEILKRAQFPSTESMVKILSKIPPEIIDLPSLIGFRNALSTSNDLRDKILKYLSHHKSVNNNLMLLLSQAYYSFNYLLAPFINKIILTENFAPILIRLKNINAKSVKWNITLAAVDSLEQLERQEHKLNLAIQHKKDLANRFPTPPFPDTENIIALQTVADQTAWANKQHNCIKTFIGSVQCRKSYFYKVITEYEEATLELKIYPDHIRKGDLHGLMNTKVYSSTETLIDDWFRKNHKEWKQKHKKNYVKSGLLENITHVNIS